MRISAYRGDFEGSFLYRIGLPLIAAADQDLADVSFPTSAEVDPSTDVLLRQRLITPESTASWCAASAPLKVLDYDDDLLHLRPTNLMFEQVDFRLYRDQWVPRACEALDASDLITVSVPHLAERIRTYTDTPVVVLPNTIHGGLLNVTASRREPGTPLRVGWAGTATHTEDWLAHRSGIVRGLKAIKADLTLVGADYRELVDYRSEWRPWTDSLTDYYGQIQDFQVMLAPLDDDEFNRSKSPIKALEAAALGIPTVAAAVGPYADFVEDGVTGFLCSSKVEWERALKQLNASEELRVSMGEAAREKARTLVTADWASRWIQTYREALTSGAHDPAEVSRRR